MQNRKLIYNTLANEVNLYPKENAVLRFVRKGVIENYFDSRKETSGDQEIICHDDF